MPSRDVTDHRLHRSERPSHDATRRPTGSGRARSPAPARSRRRVRFRFPGPSSSPRQADSPCRAPQLCGTPAECITRAPPAESIFRSWGATRAPGRTAWVLHAPILDQNSSVNEGYSECGQQNPTFTRSTCIDVLTLSRISPTDGPVGAEVVMPERSGDTTDLGPSGIRSVGSVAHSPRSMRRVRCRIIVRRSSCGARSRVRRGVSRTRRRRTPTPPASSTWRAHHGCSGAATVPSPRGGG